MAPMKGANRPRCQLLGTVAMVWFACATAVAEDGSSWTLRAGALWLDESDRVGESGHFGVVSTLDVDGGEGLNLGIEWRSGSAWGLELSAARLALDAEFTQREIRPPTVPPVPEIRAHGEFELQPVSFSLLFHLLRSARADLYLGPSLALISYDVDVWEDLDRESDWGYGAVLGLGVPLGDARRWAVDLQARYLAIERESRDRDFWHRLQTYTLGAGISYRLGSR